MASKTSPKMKNSPAVPAAAVAAPVAPPSKVPKTPKVPNKAKAESSAASAANASRIRPIETEEKKKKPRVVINGSNLHMFEEETMLLDQQPESTYVWLSFVLDDEEQETNPLIQMSKRDLLDLLNKVKPKSRIFTIPGKCYSLVPQYRTTFDETEAEWQFIDTDNNDS